MLFFGKISVNYLHRKVIKSPNYSILNESPELLLQFESGKRKDENYDKGAYSKASSLQVQWKSFGVAATQYLSGSAHKAQFHHRMQEEQSYKMTYLVINFNFLNPTCVVQCN